jgi:hypothetical protein
VCQILRYSRDYGQGGFQDRLKGTVEQTRALAVSILDALRIKYPEASLAPQAFFNEAKVRKKSERKHTG